MAPRSLALLALMLAVTTGCTLKATFESTTDTTSNFTSSTTPGAWWNADGLLKAEHKLTAFAAYNRGSLEQDMAMGHGEYLASLGTLMGISPADQSAFASKVQDQYHGLTTADGPTMITGLRRLAH